MKTRDTVTSIMPSRVAAAVALSGAVGLWLCLLAAAAPNDAAARAPAGIWFPTSADVERGALPARMATVEFRALFQSILDAAKRRDNARVISECEELTRTHADDPDVVALALHYLWHAQGRVGSVEAQAEVTRRRLEHCRQHPGRWPSFYGQSLRSIVRWEARRGTEHEVLQALRALWIAADGSVAAGADLVRIVAQESEGTHGEDATRRLLTKIAEEYPDSNLAMGALLWIADRDVNAMDYDAARERYQTILEWSQSRSEQAPSRLAEEAREGLKKVARESGVPQPGMCVFCGLPTDALRRCFAIVEGIPQPVELCCFTCWRKLDEFRRSGTLALSFQATDAETGELVDPLVCTFVVGSADIEKPCCNGQGAIAFAKRSDALAWRKRHGGQFMTYQPTAEGPITCKRRLRVLGVALRMYARQHKGMFPRDLFELFAEGYIHRPSSFWCPGDSDPEPFEITNSEPNGDASACVSYRYHAGLTLDSPPESVLLEDNSPGNHDGKRVWQLVVRGTVRASEVEAKGEPGTARVPLLPGKPTVMSGSASGAGSQSQQEGCGSPKRSSGQDGCGSGCGCGSSKPPGGQEAPASGGCCG